MLCRCISLPRSTDVSRAFVLRGSWPLRSVNCSVIKGSLPDHRQHYKRLASHLLHLHECFTNALYRLLDSFVAKSERSICSLGIFELAEHVGVHFMYDIKNLLREHSLRRWRCVSRQRWIDFRKANARNAKIAKRGDHGQPIILHVLCVQEEVHVAAWASARFFDLHALRSWRRVDRVHRRPVSHSRLSLCTSHKGQEVDAAINTRGGELAVLASTAQNPRVGEEALPVAVWIPDADHNLGRPPAMGASCSAVI